MLVVFYDKVKNVQNIIDKIKSNDILIVKEIYIEDFLDEKEKYKISESDVAYILCNNNVLINKLIEKLSDVKCKILNKEFYMQNYDKEKIQKKLLKNDIKVPKIIDFNEKFNKKLICKPKNHTLEVNIFDNIKSLEMFLNDKNIDDFYIEEYIENDVEYKIYFVNNKVFFYENVENLNNEKLNETLNKIGKILKLDVYSVDVIFNKNEEFYIIDINPSAGLFMSKDAQRELINFAK
ncbi:MAG: hypothetical protein IJ008_00960 [Clostridia bacterium]|nr:hypothetical protein [Clostridia bacterium]